MGFGDGGSSDFMYGRWFLFSIWVHFSLELVICALFGVGHNVVRLTSLHWVHGLPPFHFGNGVIQSVCRIM
jgi:hypothetical protein